MISFLILIHITVFLLSLIEERIRAYAKPIYISLGVILILCAGFREIGIDNDSEQYEYYFSHYNDKVLMLTVEYSFQWLSRILNYLSDDVHIILLAYAAMAITIKFYAFRRLSESWFMPVVIYLGYYFIMHELTQIRAGVVSSLLLLAIIPLAEGRKKLTFLILCLGCFFHYSTFAMFPMLFLNNNGLTRRKRIIWAAIVPAAYLIYFSGNNLFLDLPIPYIGDKLASYQKLRDKGILSSEINVFNAVFMVTIFTYFYVLYFYDTVIKHNKYLPLMLKMTGVSICIFIILAFIPVIAYRINALYGIVTIILFTNIYYTINPGWLARSVVGVIGIVQFMINVFYTKLLHP